MHCLVSLVVVILSLSPTSAVGTEPVPVSDGPFARIVAIRPRPGQQQEFEAGCRKHLEWHREKQDPWTWLGWSFVMGERLGLFMDGMFSHAAADFDHPVDPAGDAADNAENVIPAADFVSHGLYERLDVLGTSSALPDTTPFVAMTTYRVQPGVERFFEEAFSRMRKPESEELPDTCAWSSAGRLRSICSSVPPRRCRRPPSWASSSRPGGPTSCGRETTRTRRRSSWKSGASC